MIIRNIILQNIRSYKTPPPIQLATGTTLFEGDIGSGKSTILLSIEFALFGLGDIEGAYLLRHGEKTGSVHLEFTVDSHEYRVFRSTRTKKKQHNPKRRIHNRRRNQNRLCSRRNENQNPGNTQLQRTPKTKNKLTHLQIRHFHSSRNDERSPHATSRKKA